MTPAIVEAPLAGTEAGGKRPKDDGRKPARRASSLRPEWEPVVASPSTPAASTPCQEALWRVLCRFSEVAQENYDTGVENRILERERDYLLHRLSELGVEP